MGVSLHPAPGTRIAVVGGCGGIGRALVEAALGLDCRVVVMDLAASLAEAPPPAGVAARALDVTDAGSVAAAFAGFEGLEAVVNLAGFAGVRRPVGEMAAEAWGAVLDANLSGAFRVAQAALPSLRESGRSGRAGSLVHVASGLAARLLPGYGAYGASKAGLIALTKAIAVENAPLVRANAVAPGAVDTAFLRGGMGRAEGGTRLDVDAYAAGLPMGRIAVADDVVGPILFLCGPGAGYMTGQVLWINGGGQMP